MTLIELKDKLEEATESTWSVQNNVLSDILSYEDYANVVQEAIHRIDPHGGWHISVIDSGVPVIIVYKEGE